MLIRIYAMIWLAVGFATAVLFLTGNFTALTAVAFGFLVFGLVFMGMISVLPALMAHPEAVRHAIPHICCYGPNANLNVTGDGNRTRRPLKAQDVKAWDRRINDVADTAASPA